MGQLGEDQQLADQVERAGNDVAGGSDLAERAVALAEPSGAGS